MHKGKGKNRLYLRPFVDLFYEDRHHGLHTLINEGLYVLHSLFLIQIQAELVLDLEGRERERQRFIPMIAHPVYARTCT